MILGTSASRGIGFGHVHIVLDEQIIIDQRNITQSEVENELSRLNEAIALSSSQLEVIRVKVLKDQGEDEAAIFEAHQMLLNDPAMIKKVSVLITGSLKTVEHCYDVVANDFIEKFKALEDPYFNERALDIADISKRVLRNLLNIEAIDLSKIDRPTIIVAKDLTPSQTALINPKYVKGIITELGGRSSHTAIMARTLELPAIMGVKELLEKFEGTEFVALDGEKGEFYISPDQNEINSLTEQFNKLQNEKNELKKYIGKKSITNDGAQVLTMANIGRAADLEGLQKNDAEGVGLFRTEFLYMEETKLPSETKQFELYKTVATFLDERELVIRTLDIGGDKKVDYLEIAEEENPFLGHRAIRYCLDNTNIFKTQLRAILRASKFGNIKIMFPMISGQEELLKSKAILEECKLELKLEKTEFDENIKIGIMIEIPSAAMMSDILAKEVDFFSIGTNDLIQYTVAADRMNDKVSNLYTHYHPAVLRLINMTLRNGLQAGIKVGMCGGMAANSLLTEVFLGMGLQSFSMEAGEILNIRKKIINSNKNDSIEFVNEILKCASATDIEKKLKERYEETQNENTTC